MGSNARLLCKDVEKFLEEMREAQKSLPLDLSKFCSVTSERIFCLKKVLKGLEFLFTCLIVTKIFLTNFFTLFLFRLFLQKTSHIKKEAVG